MAVIGSLSVKLGLVTVEWDQATAKAKQQAKDLQKAINSLTGDFKSLGSILNTIGGVTGLGGLGLAALTQQTLEFANATKDLAKGFDISVAKVLQFKDAIKTSGGNAEGAQKMLSSLFTKIEDAKGGNEAAISQFERLGITFAELNTLKPEEAINRIFNALNESSMSTYARVKMVKEMLGKQGIGLAVDEVAAKLNMSVESYRKNEMAIKKLGDVSDNLKTSMDNLKLAFADVISPFTTGDGLVKVESFKAALYAIGSVYLIGQLMKVYEVFMLIRKALAANAAITASLTAMGGYKGLALAAAGFATYQGAQMLFGDEMTPITNKRYAEGKLEGGTTSEEEGERPELVGLSAKIKLQQELNALEDKQNNLRIEGLTGDKKRVDLRTVEIALAIQLAQISAAREQALSKQNLSEEQQQLMREEFDREEMRARSKAQNEKEFILAQNKLANELLEAQTFSMADQLLMQKQTLELKKSSIGIDERAVALAELDLQTEAEKIRLQNQLQLDRLRANQSLEDRKELDRRYGIELLGLEGRKKIQADIINKTYERKLDLLKQTEVFQRAAISIDKDQMVLEVNRFQMRESDVRLQQEEIQFRRTMLDLNKQLANAAQMGKGEAYEQEQMRIEQLIAAERELSNARKQAIRDEEARRQSFTAGFQSAAQQFALDAENYGKLGADMFGMAIGNMNSAIDNFVRTGKLSFKDFAKSIIQDVLAMILKFQALQLVMMATRLFGVGAPAPITGAPAYSGPAYAAAGGEIDGPTIVGENGPELFIPQRRGTVIPNMQASSFMGGQPSVVYNGPYIQNMNAIDTQSATQFLSKNKSAVWSANQSAQRSLPVSK